MIVHSKMISKHHQFIGSLNEKYYHIRIKSNKMIFSISDLQEEKILKLHPYVHLSIA